MGQASRTVRLLVCLGGIVAPILLFIPLGDRKACKSELDDLRLKVEKLRTLAESNDQHDDKKNGEVNEMEPGLTEDNNKFEITEYWQAAALLTWDYDKPPEVECKNKTPGGDYFICQDPPYTIKPPCLAYSFGVYRDWRFDDTLGDMGCETHSFDPSLKYGSHLHRGVVHFHKMGIGMEDTDTFKPERSVYVKDDKQRWKLRTLPSIMKMLGHEGKVIDALKVDVEGFEWSMLEQLLETGILHRVRQFILEWHLIRNFPRKDSYMKHLRNYYRLKDAGFKIFYTDYKFRVYSRWRLQADTMYVNTKFNQSYV